MIKKKKKNQNVKLDVSCKNDKCTYDNATVIGTQSPKLWCALENGQQIMHTFWIHIVKNTAGFFFFGFVSQKKNIKM